MKTPDWSKYLAYDPDTGILAWRVKRPGPTTKVGMEAGCVKTDGRYRSFVLEHRRYYTHRVAWEIVHGPIPPGMCIDHIDGDGLNNKFTNLRLTTLSGNQRNRRIANNNRTGISGVFHHANGRGYSVYCARKYVGYFTDLAAAARARHAAEKLNGYHPNSGRARNATHNA